MFITTVN